ncbi:MFS transporter [Actinomadura sp. NPDC049382]|uniref:MFS transporter n=1 Tax=Actinomadura sp. NPDC049382 TaxID=3158220 RepID=UPI0034265698
MQPLAVRAAGGRISRRLMAAVSLPIAPAPRPGDRRRDPELALNWRWLFLVNVPLTAAGLLLARRLLPADRPGPGTVRTRLDWIGLLLLAPSLAGVLLGFSRLSEDGEITHAAVLLPLLMGAALLAAFIGWAARSGERRPIVVRLLRLRSLGSASAALFTAVAAIYAGMFLLPRYYKQLRGKSVMQAGLLLIPQGVGALAARFMIGAVVDRFGAHAVTIAGLLLAAIATAPLALAGPATNLGQPVTARSSSVTWESVRC